jgi:hypothetical protein
MKGHILTKRQLQVFPYLLACGIINRRSCCVRAELMTQESRGYYPLAGGLLRGTESPLIADDRTIIEPFCRGNAQDL